MKEQLVLTIKQRLIALIVLSTITVVGSLTIYFASHNLDEISDHLHSKAIDYGDLAGKQVRSAVAFSDRETAREVLESVVADPDVVSVTLFGDHREQLYTHGTPSPWVAKTGRTTRAEAFEIDSRIATTTPVVSLEGPTGTLVLELSTHRISEAKTHLIWIAILSGGAAVAFAALMAWLIARSVARRLCAIAEVAKAVAAGDLAQQPVEDGRRDEIGVLASAFNSMLAQIKHLIQHNRDMAHREQTRLESLVTERTAALDARNAEMRLVFDHVEQGLLVVGLDGTIAGEHSGAVERWLGAIPASRSIVDLVRAFAPAGADWFEIMWSAFADDVLPFELCVAQLPTKFQAGERQLAWSYTPFTAPGGAMRLLVVITDITAELERQRDERDERETASLVSRLLRDPNGFVTAKSEVTRLVHDICDRGTSTETNVRAVHTLKGLAAMLDLDSIASACHKLESARGDGDVDTASARQAEIFARWEFLDDKMSPFLETNRGRLDVVEHDLGTLEAAIAVKTPHVELAHIVHGWRSERAATRLDWFAEQARATALRLGKDPRVIVVADPDLRLPSSLSHVWTAFVHAIRNAVDHGVEPRATRVAAGKVAIATLTFRARAERGATIVEIVDDGPGIHWDRVAATARDRGLPSATQAELVEALFSDGVTTCDAVTEVSGRGVGMGALRDACVQAGCHIEITSVAGRGTTIRVTWSAPRRHRPSLLPLEHHA